MQESYTIGEEKDMTKGLMPIFKNLGEIDRLWTDEHFFDAFFSQKDFVVDITDNESEITVKAELPGVKKEDIVVDLQDGILTLTAEKRNEIVEDSDERIVRRESYHGKMTRSFTVGDVDTENVSASFTDGILKVVLKKKDRDFKKIEIQ